MSYIKTKTSTPSMEICFSFRLHLARLCTLLFPLPFSPLRERMGCWTASCAGQVSRAAEAVNALAFEAYVEHILAPSLSAGQIVVLDHLSVHKGVRLRRLGARTHEARHLAIGQALEAITAQDALGWFTHCGYLPAQASEPSSLTQTF